jgi:hypothetical protein
VVDSTEFVSEQIKQIRSVCQGVYDNAKPNDAAATGVYFPLWDRNALPSSPARGCHKWVSFTEKAAFANAPVVTSGLAMVEVAVQNYVGYPNDPRFPKYQKPYCVAVTPGKVTTDGFDFVFYAWGECQIGNANVGASWMAFGQKGKGRAIGVNVKKQVQ